MSRRRFGNIRRQRNGRWQARYKGPDGRERQGEQTFDTKAEAGRYLDGVAGEMHRGAWSDHHARTLTLLTYAKEDIGHRRLAPSTRELYAGLLAQHIAPQLGEMPLGKITPVEVRRWRSGRLEVTGSARTRQAYCLLRSVLATAVRDGLLPSNPCQERGAGQTNSPERPYISRAQVEALAAAMPEDMQILVTLTFWAHLRIGELLALCREDLDLAAGTLHVHRQILRLKDELRETPTKTGHGRTVHLPTQALDAMRRHLAATGPALPSARLFTHRTGMPLRRHHIAVAWHRARAEVGLHDVHWHDLRHAGLTHVASTGATLKQIMHRGGHRTVTAALIYQHAAEEHDAHIAALMSDGPLGVPDEGLSSR